MMVDFYKGMKKVGGRQKGVRNRLSHAFLNDLLQEWTEHGAETLRIARVERPIEFAKMVAGLLPREFELEINTTVTEISDDELQSMLDDVRRRLEAGNAATVIDGRAEPAPEREQVKLLSAVPDPSEVS
jgi:hypothetical protein